MKSGKILIFDGARMPFREADYELPRLKSGEILIKNIYTTLCGSDLHTYCGKRIEKTPTVLGHEVVGKIVDFALDHNHKDFNGETILIGDAVTWAVFAATPQTEWLEREMPQKSNDLFKYGHAKVEDENIFHGGLGDYTILKAHTIVLKIPAELPIPIAATVNCAVATVTGALRLAGSVSNKTVLITGLGLLGNIATAMCKIAGAKEIVTVDINSDRLNQSKRFGATKTYQIPLQTEETPDFLLNNIDVVLEMSGAPEGTELGLDCLKVGGIAVWIGAVFKTRKIQIDAEQIIRKLITIKGLHNYNFEDLKQALVFMTKHHGDFPFNEVVEKEFPLNEATEAFEYALNYKPLRVGIYIDEQK